jgi:hypothetical protein
VIAERLLGGAGLDQFGKPLAEDAADVEVELGDDPGAFALPFTPWNDTVST